MLKKIFKSNIDSGNRTIVQIRTVNAKDRPVDSTDNYHYHDFCQIVALHKGTIEFIINGIPTVIDNNSVLMFGNELAHGVVNVSSDAKITVIHISYDALSWINKIDEFRNISQFIKESRQGFLYISSKLNRRVISLSKKINNNIGFSKISYLFDLFDIMQKNDEYKQFVSHDKKESSDTLQKNTNYSKNTDSIEKAVNYLYKNFESDIKLSTLSKVAHQNTSSLCRSFKRRTGMTISQFVNRLRIEKSCTLLFDLNLSISQIAYKVGYNTFSHFSTEFKSYMKMSPTVYRKKILKLI